MLQQPKSFDHFTIVRVLGRGGMGVVYLATDERLHRPVALKVLDVYDLPDAEKKNRFLREARAAAAIRHPNVATIYEVGETKDGIPYLAMEYCEGVTLAQLLRRGAVSAKQFLLIARQIADGLAAAHRNGIVHRDIKSANIVLQDDDVVKILDFGLAKRFDASTTQSPTERLTGSASSFFGTLPYIAPEQAEGRQADARSDLFSAGVVFYELATGKLPFDDDSPLMVLEKIRDAEPAPFEPADAQFPAEAAAIISRLLQKDAADRFQTADDLANDLHAIRMGAETEPVRSSASKFSRTVRRPPSRTPYLLGSIIALVVVLTIITVLWLGQRKSGTSNVATSQAPIRSLAVLPFRNMSQSSGDNFLSVGLADALVTRLQEFPDLHIRPTSAILEYQTESVDARKAGQNLGVDGVLEGRYVTSGDMVRVNLQLTDTRTGYGVWAGSVDAERGNLILLMDKVSSSTANALNQRLSARAATTRSEPRTGNPEAYENYLKARALMGNFSQKESDAQIAFLGRAIELDPQFAAAYAEMAIALALRRSRGFGLEDRGEHGAEWYARQAVRIDPNLAQAHVALNRTLSRDPERYRESAREALAALRLNPDDPQALYPLVTYFVSTGEIEKATCIADHFASQDPSSNEARARGYFNVNAVDPEGSLQMAKLALDHRETELAGRDISAMANLTLGNLAAAEADRKRAVELAPEHYIGKSIGAMLAAARKDRVTMERELARMQRDAASNHWAALRFALCYAKIGDREKAFQWVQNAAKLGNHNWYFLVKHPWLAPLQKEPRYQALLSEMKEDLDDVRDDVIGVFQLICRRQPSV